MHGFGCGCRCIGMYACMGMGVGVGMYAWVWVISTHKCDRIWENPAYCHACAIILIIIFVTLVITLRNPYLLSYGEINLSSILY